MSEVFDFITIYWTSLLPLAVLAGIYLAVGLLSLAFRFRETEPRLRVRLLTGIFTLNLVGWSFVAISLALCGLFGGSFEGNYELGVRNIVGEAFSLSILVALPVSLFAKRRASEMLLVRLPGRERVSGELAATFQALASKMRISRARLYFADLPAPVSMAASGKSSVVVVARSLLRLLTSEELSAVLAHELAHIKNGDSFLKTLAVVYRRFLPIDPLLRLLEPAIHREREFLADEVSARVTGHPLRLASALIKIHNSYPPTAQVSVTGLSIMGVGRGFLSRHPPLKARVERLLRISDAMMLR